MRHWLGFMAFGVLAVLPVSFGCAGDDVHPVWGAMCNAICSRGDECFQIDVGACNSLCLSELGNVRCKANQPALDACMEGIGELSCTAIDRGVLPGSCDDVCLCQSVDDCDDGNQCTAGMCDIDGGECSFTPVADGVSCVGDAGTCQEGRCVMACTETGIRSAVVAGGGPYAFACDGPTTVTTQGEIVIDKDLILDGGGNLTIDADGRHRVFSVSSELYFPIVELRNLAITGGGETDRGGGIYNFGALTLDNCMVSGNAARSEGGGVSSNGPLTIIDTTISGNTVPNGRGGGILGFDRLTIVNSRILENTGGGISSGGLATIIDSSIERNTGTQGGFEGGGAAIVNGSDMTIIGSTVSENVADDFEGSAIGNFGELTMLNSTVSGNTGSGVRNGGTARLISCTFAENTGYESRAIHNEGRVTLRNTIVSGGCDDWRDVEWVSEGGNLESPGDNCELDHETDQVNVAAEQLNLGPLQDNGGPTPTHLPGSPSAAIDAVPDGACVDAGQIALTTDQRGELRPKGPRCDSGAVEAEFDPCLDIDCDDGNDCTRDGVCNPENAMCEGGGNEPENTPCDQGGGRFCDGSGNCVECNDASQCDDGNDCTNDSCAPGSATCVHTSVENDTSCAQGAGTCQEGICLGQFACTEQGIRDAITQGGGPHAFACNGPTTVVTAAEIVIDNDVTLDGVGNLTVYGNRTHRVFSVPPGVTAELRRLTITGGGVPEPDPPGLYPGGALDNEGTLALTGCAVTRNAADFQLGAIRNGGTLILTDTVVSQNAGIEPSIVTGTGINNLGTLALTRSIVSENSGNGIGGGGTMTLTRSIVSGNSGTGIVNEGTLVLNASTVSENTTDSDGGGILSGGTLVVNESTISGNTGAGGGGIRIRGFGTATLTNSTVSGNHGLRGGGISSASSATELTLINCTVAGNTVDFLDSAISNSGTATLANTVIEGDCFGRITSSGNNVESPGNTCGFDQSTDKTGVNASELKLGDLADNGGPTLTQIPGPGSIAIDAIDPEDCVDAEGEPLNTDQRGVTRPQGPLCDAGAVEVEGGAGP